MCLLPIFVRILGCGGAEVSVAGLLSNGLDQMLSFAVDYERRFSPPSSVQRITGGQSRLKFSDDIVADFGPSFSRVFCCDVR